MSMTRHGHRIPEATATNCRRRSGWLLMAVGKISFCALALLALFTMASCSGSTEGDDSVASGGIGGTGTISVGPISALGSIFVNGIEFNTDQAVVELNGATTNAGMLKVGMVVTVEGTVNEDGRTGVATSVVYGDNLHGPISAINQLTGSFTVLGQTIHTYQGTVFDTGSAIPGFAGLGLDDIIKVSGLSGADGSIQATRISQGSTGETMQISGPVSNLTGTTFRINNLTVNFSGISQGGHMSNMNGNSPQNGEVVEARGSLDDNGILIADYLRIMEPFSEGTRQMQLAGYIQTATPGSFTVITPMGFMTVLANQGTVFTGGTAADLIPGAGVRVKGSMSMGTLTALEISLTE